MKVQKIVIDTDIILEHLLHNEGASILRRMLNTYFCYTTVFNAIEAFSIARSRKEVQAVDDAMSAMKVLGLNAKSAKTMGRAFSDKGRTIPQLVAGVCLESRLPIVTMNPDRFSRVKHLKVFPVQKMVSVSGATVVRIH